MGLRRTTHTHTARIIEWAASNPHPFTIADARSAFPAPSRSLVHMALQQAVRRGHIRISIRAEERDDEQNPSHVYTSCAHHETLDPAPTQSSDYQKGQEAYAQGVSIHAADHLYPRWNQLEAYAQWRNGWSAAADRAGAKRRAVESPERERDASRRNTNFTADAHAWMRRRAAPFTTRDIERAFPGSSHTGRHQALVLAVRRGIARVVTPGSGRRPAVYALDNAVASEEPAA